MAVKSRLSVSAKTVKKYNWSTKSPAFWGCGGCEAEVDQGELAEDEVHGGVEVDVSANCQQQ